MLHELSLTFLSWAAAAPSIYLTGSFFRRFIRTKDVVLSGVIFCALGLAVLSYGVVVLSGLGILRSIYLWGLLLVPVILRSSELGNWLRWIREVAYGLRPRRGFNFKILFAFFLVSFAALWMGTLSPELGGDALCYQLNLPKVFLNHGSLAPDPLDYNSYFPLLMNNLYLIGLATGGVFAAKMYHFFCGILLFVALKRFLERETRNDLLAYFIALAVLVTPAIYNLASTTYIDVGLGFYTFLAVVVFMEALQTEDNSTFFISGLLAGCGMAIKYLCAISMVGLGVIWLFYLLHRRRQAYFSGAALFGAGMLVACGYWFMRNWGLTGNPFYPYLGTLFGEANRPPTDFYTFGFGWTWFHYVSLFFNMFLLPDRFGAFTTRIGIFYFLMTPFILLAMIFVPRARGYGIFGLVFTGVLFFIAQADRWMVPVLPVMALCAGMGVQWFYGYASSGLKKIIRSAGGAVAILILSVYVAAGIYHERYSYLLFSGKWSIEKYLLSLERTAGVADWINRNLPPDSKVLIESEPRVFYFNRPLIKQVFLEWRFKTLSKSFNNAQAFVLFLKKQGVAYILTNEWLTTGGVVSDSLALGQPLYRSSLVREIYSEDSQNIREDRYRYRLYKIL